MALLKQQKEPSVTAQLAELVKQGHRDADRDEDDGDAGDDAVLRVHAGEALDFEIGSEVLVAVGQLLAPAARARRARDKKHSSVATRRRFARGHCTGARARTRTEARV